MTPAAALKKVRAVTQQLGAFEKESHGSATFFLAEKKPSFLVFANHHHGDGRLALWAAAPPGAQAMVVGDDPEHYFVPPYVGPSGWIGVRLDRTLPWKSIEAAIRSAWETIDLKHRTKRRR